MLLETEHLSKNFGGLSAVRDLDLTVSKGEIVGLIGPNGAGKTTVLNLISGLLRPSKGKVLLEGQDITGLQGHMIASKGIARTFQIKNTFSNLTVLENAVLALNLTLSASICRALACIVMHRVQQEEKDMVSRAMAILSDIGLEGLANNQAGILPLAQEKFLGLVMAIVEKPKLLLLDEPVAGMNKEEMVRFMTFVVKYAQDMNMGVLLVEHTMPAVMNYCTRVVVLNYGEQIACGTPEVIRSDPKVQKAYLGERA